jgi:hypothetical protein
MPPFETSISADGSAGRPATGRRRTRSSRSTSPALCVFQTCAPLIKDSGGGSSINIGSLAGITGNFSTAYSSYITGTGFVVDGFLKHFH